MASGTPMDRIFSLYVYHYSYLVSIYMKSGQLVFSEPFENSSNNQLSSIISAINKADQKKIPIYCHTKYSNCSPTLYIAVLLIYPPPLSLTLY
jgi:hypothetical protein